MQIQFEDRQEAGKFLAPKLVDYANRDDVLILALPRGGVPVAYEVALALNLPMDVFIVRKLGIPGHEEMAMGAIASGNIHVINHTLINEMGISEKAIKEKIATEQRELDRREHEYRDNRPPPTIAGKTVILVDDGLATGASMWAAVLAVRQQYPASVIVAVPTASPETCRAFQDIVDDIVCAFTPEPFLAVGLWYKDFSQVSDDEVRTLLQQAAQKPTYSGNRR